MILNVFAHPFKAIVEFWQGIVSLIGSFWLLTTCDIGQELQSVPFEHSVVGSKDLPTYWWSPFSRVYMKFNV